MADDRRTSCDADRAFEVSRRADCRICFEAGKSASVQMTPNTSQLSCKPDSRPNGVTITVKDGILSMVGLKKFRKKERKKERKKDRKKEREIECYNSKKN